MEKLSNLAPGYTASLWSRDSNADLSKPKPTHFATVPSLVGAWTLGNWGSTQRPPSPDDKTLTPFMHGRIMNRLPPLWQLQ